MITGAGDLDRRVTFQRPGSDAEDAMGVPVEGWSDAFTCWADINYGTGRERREAGIEGADQSATVRVRASNSTKALTPANRIVFDGVSWDITSVAPFERTFIDFAATRRASA